MSELGKKWYTSKTVWVNFFAVVTAKKEFAGTLSNNYR